MEKPKNWMFLLIALSVLLVSPLVASAELADILYEKGILTKEDYIKSQAETEKLAEAEERRLEEEFPVKLGYGSKGFEIRSRDGKYSTQVQWRLQFRYA